VSAVVAAEGGLGLDPHSKGVDGGVAGGKVEEEGEFDKGAAHGAFCFVWIWGCCLTNG
jgi:hypothetical protein